MSNQEILIEIPQVSNMFPLITKFDTLVHSKSKSQAYRGDTQQQQSPKNAEKTKRDKACNQQYVYMHDIMANNILTIQNTINLRIRRSKHRM